MEPTNFYFDVRDIFRSPRIALSNRKIWLFLKANLFGFAVYWIISYLAMYLNGGNLFASIEKYGLYPCLYSMDEQTIPALIVYWIGIFVWLLAIINACIAVSRLTIQQLKGNELFSVADARKFANEYKFNVLLSSVSILTIALFFTIGLIIIAFIGKIPFVGEILFVFLYIGVFFAAIFILYTLIVFIVSIIYSPAIIATLEEDTIGTVYQNYAITWSQPWRLIAYNSILIPLVIFSTYIIKTVAVVVYAFINIFYSAEWLMGDKIKNIVGWATDLVTPWSLTVSNPILLSIQEGVGLSTTEYMAATILAIVLFVFILIILSYGLTILSVGETIIFIITKMKSTGENLLERVEKDSLLKSEDETNSELAVDTISTE